MARIHADESVKALLSPIAESSEIYDDGGALLGKFIPRAELDRKAASLFDPEEIRRARMSTASWRTTDEMLDHLRSLEKA